MISFHQLMPKTLGKKLWKELETAQGYSFVSDDMCYWEDERIIEFCLSNMDNVKKVVRVFKEVSRGYELVKDDAKGL